MNAPVWAVWLVDAVIAFTVLEAVLLLALQRWRGRGVPARDFLLNLISGLCLMAALRCAVAGSLLPGTALPLWLPWLAAAGVAHAGDLARRWR